MLRTTFVLATALCVVGAGPSKLFRPCNLKDYDCIQDNLSANSRCARSVRNSIPPAYTLYNVRFETPYFNSSYVDNTLVVRNHNKCFVSEYTVNSVSGTVVLAIDCPGLDLESDRTVYQHYSLREDSIYQYHIRGVYPLVRLTTTLPYRNQLNLCDAFTFADVAVLPIFKVDPKNKPTRNFLSQDLSFIPIYERETFLYRAKQLFRYYINSFICDFKCNF